MKGYTIKPFLIICLIAIFIIPAWSDGIAFQSEDNAFLKGLLRGRSYIVTFNLGEEEHTDILTFGEDGSFTMEEMGKFENSTGFYIGLFGMLFFANFSGSFLENPFSFSFYGIHLDPNISGIDFINFFGSPYCGIFSGTEINN